MLIGPTRFGTRTRMAALLSLALGAHALPAQAAGRVACNGGDATAAISAALAGGGVVQLSAGTCLVSATLHVGSDTVVKGAGIGKTLLRAPDRPNFPVIAIGGGTQKSGAMHVEVAALSIDAGNRVAIGARDTSAIVSRWSSRDVNIHDLEAYAAGANGIEVSGSDVTVARNLVHDNQANGIYVIGKGHPDWNDAVPASNVRIIGNRVANNSRGRTSAMRHGWDGIDLDPITRNCLVQGNIVTGNDIILLESGTVVAASTGNRVIGNTITDVTQGDAGIDVAGPQDDFAIVGNTIRGVQGWGIVINGPVRHGVVRGNTISGATRAGIQVRDTGPTARMGRPTDIVIQGNTVVPTPGQPAIAILHRAADVRVVDNAVGPAGRSAIVTTGAGAGLVVQGNR